MSSVVKTIKEATNLSSLSKTILLFLVWRSNDFNDSVSLTVEERREWGSIVKSTGEIEDFAAIINSVLTESGSDLEFFSGPGFWNGEEFISKVNEKPDEKRRATFWFCLRVEISSKRKKTNFVHDELAQDILLKLEKQLPI